MHPRLFSISVEILPGRRCIPFSASIASLGGVLSDSRRHTQSTHPYCNTW